MASANETPEVKDPPAGSWTITTAMERVMYKTKMVCQRCSIVVGYVNGNTSSVITHIQRHYPNVPITGTRKNQTRAQLVIPAAFKQTLDTKAERDKQLLKHFAFILFCSQGGTYCNTFSKAQDLLLLLYLFCIFSFIA